MSEASTPAVDSSGAAANPPGPAGAAEKQARRLAAELFDQTYPSINRYVDILMNRGIPWGLLGPREADRLWDRHVLNSIAIADLLPSGAALADVGSGAGLPGIPLAILRPDLRVTCLESLQRRSTFLTETVDELGLADRVHVVRTRAEDFPATHTERFDVVTSRAVAPLGRLARWCAPLLTEHGTIVAIKGRSATDELERDRAALRRAHLAAEVIPCRAGAAGPMTYAVVAHRHHRNDRRRR